VDHDKLVPIYPESEGLTNRQIRKLIERALAEIKVSEAEAQKKNGSAVNRYGGAVGGAKAGPKLGASAYSSRLPTALRNKQETQIQDVPAQLEKLPAWLRDKYGLVSRLEALEKLHSPPPDAGSEFINLSSPYH